MIGLFTWWGKSPDAVFTKNFHYYGGFLLWDVQLKLAVATAATLGVGSGVSAAKLNWLHASRPLIP